MNDLEKKSGFGGQSILTLIACLFVFISLSGNGAVTPALNAMRTGLWSTLPPSTVSLIATLPNLFAIAGGLVSGWLAGKVLSWRSTIIVSFTIYLVFGIAPVVLNLTEFYSVLVMRAGFGLGMGMLWPLGNALIIRVYEGTTQSNILGWGQSVQSAGGVAMQMIGGWLATIAPQNAFWAYLIAALGLILALIGIPKLPLEKKSTEKKEREKIPTFCWGFLVLLLIGVMCIVVTLMETSTIMAQRGFGGSFGAGIVTSAYTIGGVISGLIFGQVFKKLGMWLVPIGYLCCVCSVLIVAFASSAIMLFCGLFLSGFIFIMVRPSIYKIISMDVTPGQMAAMIGIAAATYNFGTFLTSYFMKAVAAIFTGGVETTEWPLYVGAVIFLIMAVTVSIYLVMRKKKATNA